MNIKMLHVACVVCLLLCLALVMFPQNASAGNPDQNIAEQHGLGSKKIDKDRLPGKLEMGLAVGSLMLMIGVVKWL